MPIEKSAGAIIFSRFNKRIEYLLLHYQAGHWDFPKGNIEKGEKPADTARREIFEETGIKDINFIPGFVEWIKYFYKRTSPKFGPERAKKTVFKIVTFFLARTETKKVKISKEHIGYKWLSYEKAMEKLTFKNAKEILKKANKFISKKGL